MHNRQRIPEVCAILYMMPGSCCYCTFALPTAIFLPQWCHLTKHEMS